MLRKTRIWKTLGATTLRQGRAAVPPKGKRPMHIMSNRIADSHGSAGQVSLMGGRVPGNEALVTAECTFYLLALTWVQAQNKLAGNGSGMWNWSMKRRGSRWNSQPHCEKSGSYAIVRLA